jgi:copper transport protein
VRRSRALALLGGPVLALVVGLATPASAHAGLESSDPADGAQLDTAPTQIALTFTETPDASLSSVQVLEVNGASVAVGAVTEGRAPRQLVAPLAAGLPDGSYTVSWRVVSQDDGHVTLGTFAFGVGQAPAPPSTGQTAQATTPGPSALGVFAKVLLYLGLALMVGAAAAGLWAFGGHVPARRILLPVAGTSALVGALLFLAAERATIDVSFAVLLRSSTGQPLIWLVVGAAATAAGAWYASRDPSRTALLVAGIAAVVTMYTRAEGGHAATGGWLQVVLQWIHFVAVGVWIGGLVPVLLLLRERRRADGPAPIPEVARYSTMAGWALLAVIGAGIARSVNELGGFGAITRLFATSYGTTLAIKVSLVLILVALGAANRYRSIPRLAAGDGPLRRFMTMEVGGAIGVFVLTGVLTGLAPNPPEPAAPGTPMSIAASGADFATTMRVDLTATPGTPGANTFHVTVDDYDTGEPLPVNAVTLLFTAAGRPDLAPSELDLDAHGSAWAADGTNLSLAGAWDVTARVREGARTTEVPLTLVTRAPDQQVATSSPIPGQPTVYTITLPGGEQLQAYNDPGSPGPDQLHLTAFDAAGQELPLTGATIVATPGGGSAQVLKTERFGPGHFVASVDLTEGPWHFDLAATAEDGTGLAASFDETIGAS